MTLAIFLAIGDSFSDMKNSGQDIQFKRFYLPAYAAKFKKIYIFSYAKEKVGNLPKNIEVIENNSNQHRYLYAFRFPFINKEIIKRCDMIRVYHVTGTVPAIIAKLFYKTPYIFNYAYDYKKFAVIDRKYFQALLLCLLEPIAFFFAGKVFIAGKRHLKKLKKNVFLPNGVNTQHFKPYKKQQDDTFRILSVGRLTNQKNLHSLIESLKDLVKVRLTIVGSGPLKNSLLNAAKKDKVDLNIIDNVPNDQMPEIYNRADIFVLPSKIEGHPKSLLEAMSCALPVICTNISGSSEIVKDKVNGLIAQPSHQDIKEKIIKLIDNRNLRLKLSANARGHILKNFDLAKLIQKEIETIQSLK